MEGKIRVLQILGIVAGGGVESVIMNYYEHIDRTNAPMILLWLPRLSD